jgi:hypothetical protein
MASPDRGQDSTPFARERLDYLGTIYERIARYDQLIQNYELHIFTVLSVLVSADIILVGVLTFFRLFEPLLWVFSAAALAVAGIGVATLYNRRIQFFVLQRGHSEDIASLIEEKVVTELFPASNHSERENMMTNRSLIQQRLQRQGLLLRVTFYSYVASFAFVLVVSAVLAYLFTH